jgi:heat shock protein HslJ
MNKTTWWVVGVIVAILIVLGVYSYSEQKNNPMATSTDNSLTPSGDNSGNVSTQPSGGAQPASVSLGGTQWLWSYTFFADKTRTAPTDGSKFVLSFANNGTFTSTTDCNSLGGTYKAGASSLMFSKMTATLMGCPNSHEGDYSSELAQTTSYTIAADQLFLNMGNRAGTMVFSLKK